MAGSSASNAGKALVDKHYGNQDCRLYRDFRELLDELASIHGCLRHLSHTSMGYGGLLRFFSSAQQMTGSESPLNSEAKRAPPEIFPQATFPSH